MSDYQIIREALGHLNGDWYGEQYVGAIEALGRIERAQGTLFDEVTAAEVRQDKAAPGREAQLATRIADLETQVALLTAENTRLLGDPGHDTIGKFSRKSEEARLAALRELPKTGTKRAAVLDVIRAAYPVGLADEQIHRRVGGDIRSINARRKELEEGGWVVKHTAHWLAPSGNTVSTWTLSPTAVEVLVA